MYGVKNIKSLLDESAKDKYTLKSLYNDQVKVQASESQIYTKITKGLV